MSFELSFSPEFFYDGVESKSKKPHTVYQALKSMPRAKWKAICEDVFPGIDPGHIGIDNVVDKIRETNSCTDISSPVEVWIGEEGWHTVRVWEEDPRKQKARLFK